MKKIITLSLIATVCLQLSGCSVISAVSTGNRMEAARSANAGKQLIPKDGNTYLIPVGKETVSYLGSGNTDFKINNTSFTQPKGTYSIVKVSPGKYSVYGNMRVIAGGEASTSVEVKESEVICLSEFNPISGPARIDVYKNDACDPIIRALKNQNAVEKIN